MKTVTFQSIFDQAIALAQRTPDKIPVVEKNLLQTFLTLEFADLFTSQPWPELIPDFFNVTNIQNRQFSLNEGSQDPAAPEFGDILAILTRNPRQYGHWHKVPYTLGNGVVYLEDNLSSVWVEYQLPYPGTAFAELEGLALADFLARTCPARFAKILAHRGAGHLLNSDPQPAAAQTQALLAERALADEILRLPPIPAWRGFHSRRVRRGY